MTAAALILVAQVPSTPVGAVTYGDYVTDTSQYPEVVSIWEFGSYDYSFVCSGTLIDQSIVLTAAHCVRGAGELLVEVGATELGNGANRFVTGTWVHPRYSERKFENDVALLYLGNPADVANVAALPKPRWRASSKSRYQLLGWGEDQNGDSGTLRLLDAAPADSLAKSIWKSSFNPRTAIAAGRHFKAERLFGGACRGDSGGPLFLKGEPAAKRVVVGITSWGARDCEAMAPSVFASTAFMLPEIRKGRQFLNQTAPATYTPLALSAIVSRPDRSNPEITIGTSTAEGQKIRLVCFELNGEFSNRAVRGWIGLPAAIASGGCTWTAVDAFAFRYWYFDLPTGRNTVTVSVMDKWRQVSSVTFELCRTSFAVDVCSGFTVE